jgi:hypothetical protein
MTTAGPSFKLTRALDKEESEWARKLRLVAHNNREAVIREYFKCDPRDFQWVPVEGTEERKWFDRINECLREEQGTYVGKSGAQWHNHRDGKRLLTSCRNSVEWKNEARRFWWDTTNSVSFRADDCDFPGV